VSFLWTFKFKLTQRRVISSQAYAASATLVLTRTSTLTNVSDAEGTWQYDGGDVYYNNSLLGYYSRTKRVSNGVGINAGAVTITIYLIGQNPPQNVTLQGTHDFSSGNEIGSISAASNTLTYLIGGTFSGPQNSITLTW
jgi:hypothetical protein